MPLWPVNQRIPRRSNVAVFRFAQPLDSGSGKRSTSSVAGSTRTMAFSPPSVTHAAPSGPTITPCGAEPSPSGTCVVLPVAGSSRPSSPVNCAVYQTEPSGAGATSCGCDPAGTGYSRTLKAASPAAVPHTSARRAAASRTGTARNGRTTAGVSNRSSSNEMPRKRSAGELLADKAGKEQNGAAGTIVRRDVPSLPGRVPGDQDGAAEGLAADLRDVDLEEAVLAVGAGELELLVVIQRADADQDRADVLRALR